MPFWASLCSPPDALKQKLHPRCCLRKPQCEPPNPRDIVSPLRRARGLRRGADDATSQRGRIQVVWKPLPDTTQVACALPDWRRKAGLPANAIASSMLVGPLGYCQWCESRDLRARMARPDRVPPGRHLFIAPAVRHRTAQNLSPSGRVSGNSGWALEQQALAPVMLRGPGRRRRTGAQLILCPPGSTGTDAGSRRCGATASNPRVGRPQHE